MDYKHQPLPYVHGANFIRLVSLLPGKGRLQLRFHTKPIRLGHEAAEPFEALSYVWGTKNKPSQAEIVGLDENSQLDHRQERETISITQNLAEALHHLRDLNESRTLWIDSVCIDQNNLIEKSHQVSFMGKIYKHARRVVIWLGLAADDSDRAFDLIEQIGSQVTADWVNSNMSPAPGAKDPSLAMKLEPFPAYFTNDDAKALEALFARSWFERIWVRQENAMASSAFFQAGHKTIDRTLMQNAAYCFMMKGIDRPAVLDCQSDSTCEDGGRIASREYDPWSRVLGSNRSWLVLSMCEPAMHFPPGWLHYHAEGMHCGDPRDRVYGLLSLLQGLDNGPSELVLDYQAPFEDCYRDVALHHIMSDRSLSILASCSLSYKTLATPQSPPRRISRSSRLPSWVPDWSVDMDRHLVRSPIVGARPLLTSAEYLGDGILRVEGVACSTVNFVSKVENSSMLAMFRSLRKICLEILKTSSSNEIRGQRIYGPTGQTWAETLSRVLTMDRFCETFYPQDPEIISAQKMLDAINRLLSIEDDNFSWADLCLHSPGDPLDSPDPEILFVLKSFSAKLSGRLLFTTIDGHLGIGPLCLQPGDNVCILLGCESAIALRLQSSNPDTLGAPHEIEAKPTTKARFLTLGDCFVPGLMAGEPLFGPLPSHLRLVRRPLNSDDDQICYLDTHTGDITSLDPRMEVLEMKLSEILEITCTEQEFKIKPCENHRGKHGELRYEVNPQHLRMSGVDLRHFDLI